MTKTATDLKRAGWPRDELLKYRPWQAIERHRKDQDLISHHDLALSVARKVAVILKKRFGAKRVVLFGSLSQDAWFTPRSDIDLCAEGIPVERFFRAEAEIEAMASGFKVDLIDFRECSPELLKRVEGEGIEL
jgi:predicted nucleotidyltransferase